MEKTKTIKGFNRNLQCDYESHDNRQYKIGETYTEEGKIELYENGIHAINPYVTPFRIFKFYPPADSRYCEVEASGEVDIEEYPQEIAVSKLTVVKEIGIPELVSMHKERVKQDITSGETAIATYGNACSVNFGESIAAKEGVSCAGHGSKSSAGYKGISCAGHEGMSETGDYGVSCVGHEGISEAGRIGVSSAGEQGVSRAGDGGVSSAGDKGVSFVGDDGVASAGRRGMAIAGNDGVAASLGASSVGSNGIAVACEKVKGDIGSVLVLVHSIKEWKATIVDGETIKANTWYTVENGEWVEIPLEK